LGHGYLQRGARAVVRADHADDALVGGVGLRVGAAPIGIEPAAGRGRVVARLVADAVLAGLVVPLAEHVLDPLHLLARRRRVAQGQVRDDQEIRLARAAVLERAAELLRESFDPVAAAATGGEAGDDRHRCRARGRSDHALATQTRPKPIATSSGVPPTSTVSTTRAPSGSMRATVPSWLDTQRLP